MQRVLPSLHLLELFMPIHHDEKFLLDIIKQVQMIPFYKGLELGVLRDSKIRESVNAIVEQNSYQLTTWLSPSITEKGFNLSSLDTYSRKQAVAYTIELMSLAAETGTTHCGLPSGDYPGDEKCEDAKKALFESFCELQEAINVYRYMDFTLEPLDRYAHKKQLLGPMPEVIQWFSLLKKECPSFYIHWDSAHEMLGGIDLIESLELAQPYLAQFHICNCIVDKKHPCYGDFHMDIGRIPDFKTWGYLTPEIGSSILKKVASFNTVTGVKNTHCAIEVRSHMGDDLWEKERSTREFFQLILNLAGLAYEK